MARELFRVTVDEPNFTNMLGEPLDVHQKARLPDRVINSDEIRVWAINTSSPTANAYHHFMKSGDGLLFYKVKRGLADDEKRYVGIARIGEKFETSSDTAKALFQTPTASLMFTVNDFHPMEKTIDDIKKILGYKQHPQRTQRVKPNRYRSVDSVFNQLLR